MRILIIGLNYFPELTGTGKYTGEMAEWLAQRGHDVRVVSGPPYYPDWRVRKGYSQFSYSQELLNGVEVLRCPIWIPSQVSGVKRLFHLMSFALSSLPILLRQIFWKPELVMVIAPPIFSAPAALLVAKLSRSLTCVHIQDFELDAAFDLGLLKGAWIKKIALAVERGLLSQFDVVSSISRGMLQKAAKKGISSTKTVFFPNWVDLQPFKKRCDDQSNVLSDETSAQIRKELGIPQDAIVALYSGNMGQKQGLEVLVDVAQLCHSSSPLLDAYSDAASNPRQLFFVFCGNGVMRNEMIQDCKQLDNVRFIDLQPLEKLTSLLTMADIHLLPQRAEVTDLVMPSKLTGMLASGRPVVANALEGSDVFDAVNGRGIIVAPGNSELFAEAVMQLAQNSDLRLSLGKSGFRYSIEMIDKDSVLKKFEQFLISKMI